MRQIREPQYIIDGQGNKTSVILDIESFETLIEALEELNDIQVAADARASGEYADRIPLADVVARFAKDSAA